MAEKKIQAREKTVTKMTRDGVVDVNLVDNSVTHVSDRKADNLIKRGTGKPGEDRRYNPSAHRRYYRAEESSTNPSPSRRKKPHRLRHKQTSPQTVNEPADSKKIEIKENEGVKQNSNHKRNNARRRRLRSQTRRSSQLSQPAQQGNRRYRRLKNGKKQIPSTQSTNIANEASEIAAPKPKRRGRIRKKNDRRVTAGSEVENGSLIKRHRVLSKIGSKKQYGGRVSFKESKVDTEKKVNLATNTVKDKRNFLFSKAEEVNLETNTVKEKRNFLFSEAAEVTEPKPTDTIKRPRYKLSSNKEKSSLKFKKASNGKFDEAEAPTKYKTKRKSSIKLDEKPASNRTVVKPSRRVLKKRASESFLKKRSGSERKNIDSNANEPEKRKDDRKTQQPNPQNEAVKDKQADKNKYKLKIKKNIALRAIDAAYSAADVLSTEDNSARSQDYGTEGTKNAVLTANTAVQATVFIGKVAVKKAKKNREKQRQKKERKAQDIKAQDINPSGSKADSKKEKGKDNYHDGNGKKETKIHFTRTAVKSAIKFKGDWDEKEKQKNSVEGEVDTSLHKFSQKTNTKVFNVSQRLSNRIVDRVFSSSKKQKASKAASKALQKKMLNRKYAKNVFKKNKNAEAEAASVASNIAQKLLRIVREAMKLAIKKVLASFLGAILGIVLIVFILFTACSALTGVLFTSVVSSIYLAEDQEIHDADLNWTEKETDLTEQVENFESENPGYNEYNIDVNPSDISHDPFELIAYLTAMYQDFKYEDVSGIIEELFDKQYQLKTEEITEIRTRIEMVPDGAGGLRPIEIPYEYKIMNVTLESKTFEEVIKPILEENEVLDIYEHYMETKGGRQTYQSPFDTDWQGSISSNYGYRVHPITGERDFHRGLDIAMPGGTPIKAIHDGTVISAAYNDSYGNYIVLESEDGKRSLYAHCNSLLASAGDVVTAGDVIAEVGTTGSSTGNHLHLEIAIDGNYLNPIYVLSY